VVGLIVIALFVVVAMFAPWIAPYDPAAQSWTAVRKAPSAAHWLGTDDVGRDVLSRVIFGARASLLAAVISAVIVDTVGVPLGLRQQPPAPSWRSMLNSAPRFLTTASWMAMWPGLAIFLTVLSFNLVGDGLRDALDPKER